VITGAIIETTTLHSIANARLPLLYGGLISVAIAYTLQVFAQQNVQPSSASLILSFETVFAVIGGALLLGETLLIKQVVGCLLMLGGILMVQMQEK
jgi:drug/metabolite transporter (DMT)-like permease